MRKMTAIIFVMCFFGSLITVEATSGRMSASKITYCSGVPYGRHGKDEHWHKAEKNGDYWNAIGPDLGYNHPCPSTPPVSNNQTPSNPIVNKPSTNEQSQADSIKKAQEEAKRLEQEKLARIEAEKKAKEEADRLKFEEEKRILEEKLKLEEEKKEKLKLSNTKLHSVKSKGFENLANNEIVYSNLNEDILIQTANDKATYSLNEVTNILPFNKGQVLVNVTSENGDHVQTHTIDVFKVGSQSELEQQNIFLVYDDTKYPFENNKFSISNDDLRGFSGISPVLEINDITVISFTSDIDEVTTKKKDVIISFTLGDENFVLPVEKIEDNSSKIVISGVSVIGTVGGVVYYLKNKKSKKSL